MVLADGVLVENPEDFYRMQVSSSEMPGNICSFSFSAGDCSLPWEKAWRVGLRWRVGWRWQRKLGLFLGGKRTEFGGGGQRPD